ncbi:uncharacterized protein CLUP02_08349 [Colletotrichum lupini]|uniref:Uncharacterized protein n=1 Tax=Colletotrichum lupini TaxID=145971 RepID=A0A9Q8SSN2_9PEZI|nr:uncharacterized protein CLUP02_08349 [Colletotrichum lupini]UQC82859.1 hypothetical protein CLUP02_08349 [Colletotrichum lupini]
MVLGARAFSLKLGGPGLLGGTYPRSGYLPLGHFRAMSIGP